MKKTPMRSPGSKKQVCVSTPDRLAPLDPGRPLPASEWTAEEMDAFANDCVEDTTAAWPFPEATESPQTLRLAVRDELDVAVKITRNKPNPYAAARLRHSLVRAASLIMQFAHRWNLTEPRNGANEER